MPPTPGGNRLLYDGAFGARAVSAVAAGDETRLPEIERGRTHGPETATDHPRCAADLYESTHPEATRPVSDDRFRAGCRITRPAIGAGARHEIGRRRQPLGQPDGVLEQGARRFARLR